MIELKIEGNFFVLTDLVKNEEVFREPKSNTKFFVYTNNVLSFDRITASRPIYGAPSINYLFADLQGSIGTTWNWTNLITYLSSELSAPTVVGGSGSGISLGTTSTTAHRGDHGTAAFNHSQETGNPHGTTADQITEAVDKRFVTDAEKTAITHSNRSVLDLITEAFTTALKSAYDSASSWVSTNGTNVTGHVSSTSNPHGVTKAQVGLGSVDNTSDTNKPVSTAQATAIGLKEDSANKSTLTTDSASSVKYPVWSAIVAFFSASQIRSILGVTTLNGSNTGDETTATIQAKRPLKTVNGNSLEGMGDVIISGGGGGGLSHQQAMSRISIGF